MGDFTIRETLVSVLLEYIVALSYSMFASVMSAYDIFHLQHLRAGFEIDLIYILTSQDNLLTIG